MARIDVRGLEEDIVVDEFSSAFYVFNVLVEEFFRMMVEYGNFYRIGLVTSPLYRANHTIKRFSPPALKLVGWDMVRH
jgi:hypothetical protein